MKWEAVASHFTGEEPLLIAHAPDWDCPRLPTAHGPVASPVRCEAVASHFTGEEPLLIAHAPDWDCPRLPTAHAPLRKASATGMRSAVHVGYGTPPLGPGL